MQTLQAQRESAVPLGGHVKKENVPALVRMLLLVVAVPRGVPVAGHRHSTTNARYTTVRVIVIGGGIGGLTTALALVRRGVEVELFEQRPGLRELGAGIGLSPNATNILHRLGLEEALRRSSVLPSGATLQRWDDGRMLVRHGFVDHESLYGAPTYLVRRSDLVSILARELPEHVLQTGRRCVGVTEEIESVSVQFADGGTASADAVVGADGMGSEVRKFFGCHQAPIFSGLVAYRGLIPAERASALSIGSEVVNWTGPRSYFLYYPAGPRYLNVVGDVTVDEWRYQTSTVEIPVGEFLSHFEMWHPQVISVIELIEHPWKMPLYRLDSLPRWTSHRVTLVGDAAHPVMHFIAQGAALAIEDAAVVARCLAEAGSSRVPAALAAYESVRKPRTTKCQLKSYEMMEVGLDPDRERPTAGGQGNWLDWVYAYDADREASLLSISQNQPEAPHERPYL